jgi:hypothetical protein
MSQEYFFIPEGGPIYRALTKLRLEKKQSRLIFFILCITWLPLVIITIIEGTFSSGVEKTFLNDVAIQFRQLISLPMLLLIRFFIDGKVSVVVNYLSNTLVSADDKEKNLPRVLKRTKGLTNSVWAEIIIIGVVIALTISPIKGGMMSGVLSEKNSWMFISHEGKYVLSFAGKWAVYISIPVFQFVLFWWFWRYFVWIGFLFRISRMKLDLQPTHPDQAGGLGIIFIAQKYFILFFVALSLVVSGELITQLLSDPDSFNNIRGDAIGYIIVCLCLLLFPTVFFTGKLLSLKHKGLVNYSNLGNSLSSKFENEWINENTIENKLKESMTSTSIVQDYSTIFRSLEQIRPFPVTLKDVLIMIFLLLIPYVPILFIQFSIGELLQKLIGLII